MTDFETGAVTGRKSTKIDSRRLSSVCESTRPDQGRYNIVAINILLTEMMKWARKKEPTPAVTCAPPEPPKYDKARGWGGEPSNVSSSQFVARSVYCKFKPCRPTKVCGTAILPLS